MATPVSDGKGGVPEAGVAPAKPLTKEICQRLESVRGQLRKSESSNQGKFQKEEVTTPLRFSAAAWASGSQAHVSRKTKTSTEK